ncbi:MAG: hypothetical protein U0S12_15180 [Fimbriimonadales bacterium]
MPRPTKSKQHQRRKVVVLFDTNILFTKSVTDFLSAGAAAFLQKNSNHKDIHLEWLVPELVLEERREQMLREARDLYPAIKKFGELRWEFERT